MLIMANKFLTTVSVLATVFLLVMMNVTTPQSVGPFGVLVFFTMFYLICLGVMVGLMRFLFWVVNKDMGVRRAYYYGTVLAFAPVIIVALGSFGGAGVLEVVLVGLLMLVGCFIVSKRL